MLAMQQTQLQLRPHNICYIVSPAKEKYTLYKRAKSETASEASTTGHKHARLTLHNHRPEPLLQGPKRAFFEASRHVIVYNGHPGGVVAVTFTLHTTGISSTPGG